MASLPALLEDIRACTICAKYLPLGPRPVVQAHASSRVLIVGQAPGRKVHETGLPFNDASGNRLRDWLGVSRDVFYDERKFAIVPMGFCFPGTGPSGDLPPRPECAATWRAPLLARLKRVELTIVLGQYAIAYHLPGQGKSVTEAVSRWQETWPTVVALPHPSPRNLAWFKRHPWFEEALLPVLRARVADILSTDADGKRIR